MPGQVVVGDIKASWAIHREQASECHPAIVSTSILRSTGEPPNLPRIYVGSRDLNSSPCVCGLNTLATEAPPEPHTSHKVSHWTRGSLILPVWLTNQFQRHPSFYPPVVLELQTPLEIWTRSSFLHGRYFTQESIPLDPKKTSHRLPKLNSCPLCLIQ